MRDLYELGLYGVPLTFGAVPLELQPGESEPQFLARLRDVREPQVIADLQTRFVQQLHAASLAIGQAKSRGDVAAVRALLPIFIIYRNRYAVSGASAGQLGAFDRFILSTGTYISQALAALPDAIAAAPRAVFSGLLKSIALPAALLVGGYVVYRVLEQRAN